VYRVPANGTGLSELQNRRKCCCFIPALTTSRATPGTVPRYPGTEAAAATGTTIRATAMRMPEEAVVFRADHPFMFLIRDTRTGVVLFIGRLMNPR
jgi:hypothetical protein